MENIISYLDVNRLKQAEDRLSAVDKIIGLRGRVLEIGTGHGESCYLLASKYNCEVVGTEIRGYESWSLIQKIENVQLIEADLNKILDIYGENSFDRIISFVVWEHVADPLECLSICQKLLKPNGRKYIHAYLYGAPKLSHMAHIVKPWGHLLQSVDEIKNIYGSEELPWYFWCNRTSLFHYYEYFRRLGFLITYKNIITDNSDFAVTEADKKILNLYPKEDLMYHGFQFGLEFDEINPKMEIVNPVFKNKIS